MKFKTSLMVLVIVMMAVSGCSSSDDDNIKGKQRRTSSTSSTPESTTTSTQPAQSTIPIEETPLKNPSQIKTSWTQSELCGLITPQDARNILSMTSTPEPKFTFVEEIGARCSYTSGAGDSIYVELSTLSYKESRNLDAALNAPGEPVVISGISGVYKENALGSFYELNIKGERSNQWVAFGPSKKIASQVAETLIESLI